MGNSLEKLVEQRIGDAKEKDIANKAAAVASVFGKVVKPQEGYDGYQATYQGKGWSAVLTTSSTSVVCEGRLLIALLEGKQESTVFEAKGTVDLTPNDSTAVLRRKAGMTEDTRLFGSFREDRYDVTAYRPGEWEAALDMLYKEAQQLRADQDEKILLEVRERFGLQ